MKRAINKNTKKTKTFQASSTRTLIHSIFDGNCIRVKTIKTSLIITAFLMFFSGFTGSAQRKTWTLEECINYALSKNVQIQKADLTNDRNLLYSVQAQSNRLPSMNASVRQNFNWYEGFDSSTGQYGSSNGSNSTNYSLSSSVSLFYDEKLANKIRRINFNDILYIEGLKDYIKVYTTGEDKPVLSLNTMKSLEQKLPENKFMRVHRSFIVNLDRIDTIERSRIIFGKTYIPVSDQYKDKFQEYLDKNFL